MVSSFWNQRRLPPREPVLDGALLPVLLGAGEDGGGDDGGDCLTLPPCEPELPPDGV